MIETGGLATGLPQGDAVFGEETFVAIIRAAKAAGYGFRRLDGGLDMGEGKHFILRHDVDISPIVARRLGQIAHAEGVCSNFFFQLNADTYNPFARDVLAIMRQLRNEGHCVGLHIDLDIHPLDEASIAQTLAWFNACVAPVDMAVSFHRPKADALGRRFEGFASAYDERVFRKGGYFSDSRRSTQFLSQLAQAIADDAPLIQLLLHPEWWGGHADAAAVWQELSARRSNELSGYVIANFTKVFTEVVEYEDRPFGV